MKRYLAEAIGSFVLVVGGVGSAVLAGDKIGYVGVALAFGLSLLAMVYTIGPISGCHVNPAVTVGALLTKKIEIGDAIGYVAFQILGAIAGAGIIFVIANGAPGGYSPAASGLGANGFGYHSPAGYSLVAAFVAETVLTMFLVLTVLGSTDVKAPAGFAGLAIGFVLTLIHLVGIPITNTSVNPARSLGPALFVGGWAMRQLWLFILAPIVGAVLAAAVYRLIREPSKMITTKDAEERVPAHMPAGLRKAS
jgi:aquaporin Z